MPRPTQTRRRVIETAATLFQRQGYHATGLNQVLAEGKAPKGSLYFHFPGGKEELAAEAVRHSGAVTAEALAAAVAQARGPEASLVAAGELLAGLLEASDFHDGCPVATVALEAAADSETIRASCAEVYESWRELLIAQMAGWGVRAEDSGDLADVVLSGFEGALLLARVKRDAGVVRNVAAALGAQVARTAGRN